MEVFDAVDLVGRVHGEGDTVQALIAGDAGEAGGVVGFPSRPVRTENYITNAPIIL